MRLSIFAIIASLLILSCSKSDDGDDSSSNKEAQVTIIVYMVGDNNLNSNITKDIKEMENALYYTDTDSNLILYVDQSSSSYLGSDPQILEVKGNSSTSSLNSKTIKTYDEQDSTDPAVISEVLNDIRTLYPADSYGLILWSHATGWIKALEDNDTTSASASRSFGDDDGNNINNSDLSAALPFDFDFIWFDCCLMGNVETLYEYRNNAPILIASPTETMADGMPYEKTVPYLLEGDYLSAAQAFFNHYANAETDLVGGDSVSAYATISVYDASKLENLAATISEQTIRCGGYPTNVSRTYIQKLTYISSYTNLLYDMVDAIDTLFDDEAVDAVEEALDELILYTANTSKFMSVTLYSYSGISCYVPLNSSSYTSDDEAFYNTLSWAEAVGW